MQQIEWDAGKLFRHYCAEMPAHLWVCGGAGCADTGVGKSKQDFVDKKGSVNFGFQHLHEGNFLEVWIHSLRGGS